MVCTEIKFDIYLPNAKFNPYFSCGNVFVIESIKFNNILWSCYTNVKTIFKPRKIMFHHLTKVDFVTLSNSANLYRSLTVQLRPTGQTFNKPRLNSIKVPLK